MADPDDGKLDALLRTAAPDDAPSGFAERVVAATRARRRGRGLRRIALGAAALAALAVAYGIYAGRPQAKRPGLEVEQPAKPSVVATSPAAEEVSFAMVLPPTGEPRPRVMMARINGKTLLFARPHDERTGEPRATARSPRAMSASVSSDSAGPSFAVRFR